MSSSAVTLQSIFRQHFGAYAATRRLPLRFHKAAAALMACRTAALGGHVQACPEGHVQRVWYNSCKHRACPQCAYLSVERWLAAQQARLLACDHYHVVFTLPRELHDLWRYNRRRFADLLFRAARDTLCTLLADPRYLGATPGVIAALHTWGRTLCLHPHVHCLVTGGGVTADGEWKKVAGGFLLPVRVVQALFRGKLLAALRAELARGTLRAPDGVRFQAIVNELNRLGRVRWNVYLKERYPHGTGVVTYLGRYLKGGPIAHRRLLGTDADRVTFGYTDHRDGRRKAMTLPADDFLHRVLEHVPEPGTHGVRAYGLYATGKRAVLDRAREALGQPPVVAPPVLTWQSTWIAGGDADPTRCTVCGRPLICTATVPPAYRPAGRRRPPPAEVYYARAA
jgi:hypothetical protein